MVVDQTLSEFCAQLAERTPSPGGGATAAVVGAIGASQLQMVAEFADWTHGSPEDPRDALAACIEELLRLADEVAPMRPTAPHPREIVQLGSASQQCPEPLPR